MSPADELLQRHNREAVERWLSVPDIADDPFWWGNQDHAHTQTGRVIASMTTGVAPGMTGREVGELYLQQSGSDERS